MNKWDDVSKRVKPLAPCAHPLIGREPKRPEYFRGLRAGADPGLHQQLEGLLLRLLPPESLTDRQPRVIDLGCGAGALAQRLYELGYEVLAVDKDEKQFAATGPRFLPLDLNDSRACQLFLEQYAGWPDLVLAVEVIEHVENPWAFVRFCRRLCHSDTLTIITTPNVASWWSRFWFLLTGELWGFDRTAWDTIGHINPLTPVEVVGILEREGFSVKAIFPGGRLPIIWTYNLKRFLASLAMLPLRPFMSGYKDGWVLCYCALPKLPSGDK